MERSGKNSGVVLISNEQKSFLTTLEMRQELIKKWVKNAEIFIFELSNIAHLSGEEFANILLQRFPKLGSVFVGYDFVCGNKRSCTAQSLGQILSQKGVNLQIIPQIRSSGMPVHSARIRELLLSGDLDIANRLLGRYYSIFGDLIHGQGIGKKHLFATFNFDTSGFILPKDGVYAGFCNGFCAAIFVGLRSSDGNFSIEAHLLDYKNQDLCKRMEITFVQRIRDNVFIKDFELLKNIIAQDITKITEVLKDKNAKDINRS